MAIAAKDTAALARWYVETLGFRVVVDGGEGAWFVGPSEGEAVIEIVRATDAQRTKRARNDPGWSHLAFTVTDFDAVVASLKAKNIPFDGDVTGAPGSQRLAFFYDPDGNVLQIVDRPKPLGT
jgi:catechol 2,3-dioxygenase-like lactoylglutathione lyase family enzyme